MTPAKKALAEAVIMLDWHYDEQGAIANMDGIENPMFKVSPALDGNGFMAVERFPSGLRVLQPVKTLNDGVAWCEVAAELLQARIEQLESETK